MRDPLRVLSLFGCAAVGAILAYVFGISEVASRLESESNTQSSLPVMVADQITDDAWSSEPPDPKRIDSQPEFVIPEPLPDAAPMPRVAAKTNRQVSQWVPESATSSELPVYDLPSNGDYSSGFAVQEPQCLPTEDPQLMAPPVQMAVPVDRERSSQVTSHSPSTAGIAPANYAMPEARLETSCGEDRPVNRCVATCADHNNNEAEQDSTPYVVLSPEDSRPLLTLRLGRFESQQLSPAEMSPPPVTAARPVVRNGPQQASLFVDFDDRDLTCSINAQHVRLRDLLTILGERTGIRITTTHHVDGLVSADIVQTRLEEALDQILSPMGYSVGVRGNAILVGLHNEIADQDCRLREFAEYDQARNSRQNAETDQAEVLGHVDARHETESRRQHGFLAKGQPDQQIRFVGHNVAEVSPGSAATLVASLVPDQPDLANGVPAPPSVEIPMHVNPDGQRQLSNEELLEARRAQIADDEDNVVSIIAERALNLMRDGEYRRTVNMLSQLITEHDRSAQLFQLLGEAYYHCQQFQAAEVSLQHSLQLYRNDPRTNYFMGCTLQLLGERERSLHYLLQAHDLDPMYPPIVSAQTLAPR